MQKIRVVKKRPGMGPTLGWITKSLEAYQGFVGGYIETVPLDGVPGALIICNEEGKLQGLRENVLNGGDVIVGPIVVARVSGEDFASLTEDDIAAAIEMLSYADVSNARKVREDETAGNVPAQEADHVST